MDEKPWTLRRMLANRLFAAKRRFRPGSKKENALMERWYRWVDRFVWVKK